MTENPWMNVMDLKGNADAVAPPQAYLLRVSK
jgi:hypothetical protein